MLLPFCKKKKTVETKNWLDKQYLKSTPRKSTVEKLFVDFKQGEMNTKDHPCSVGALKRLLPTKTSRWSQNNFG